MTKEQIQAQFDELQKQRNELDLKAREIQKQIVLIAPFKVGEIVDSKTSSFSHTNILSSWRDREEKIYPAMIVHVAEKDGHSGYMYSCCVFYKLGEEPAYLAKTSQVATLGTMK